MSKRNDINFFDDICKIIRSNPEQKFTVEDIFLDLRKKNIYKDISDIKLRSQISKSFEKMPSDFYYYVDDNKKIIYYAKPVIFDEIKNKWILKHFENIRCGIIPSKSCELMTLDILNDKDYISKYGFPIIRKLCIDFLTELSDNELLQKRTICAGVNPLSLEEASKIMLNPEQIEYINTANKDEQHSWFQFMLSSMRIKLNAFGNYSDYFQESFKKEIDELIFMLNKIRISLILSVLFFSVFIVINFPDSACYVLMFTLVFCYYFLAFLKGQLFIKGALLFSVYQFIKGIPILNNSISFFDEQVSSSYILPDFNIFFTSFLISNMLLSRMIFYFIYSYRHLIIIIYFSFNFLFCFFIRSKYNKKRLNNFYIKYIVSKHDSIDELNSNKENGLVKFEEKWLKIVSKLSDVSENIDYKKKQSVDIINTLIYVISMLIVLMFPFVSKLYKEQILTQYLDENNGYCKGIAEHQLIIKMNDGTILVPLSTIVDKDIKIPEEYKEYKYMSYACEHITLIK